MITYKVNSSSSGDNYLDGVLTLIENTNKKILAKFTIKKDFKVLKVQFFDVCNLTWPEKIRSEVQHSHKIWNRIHNIISSLSTDKLGGISNMILWNDPV